MSCSAAWSAYFDLIGIGQATFHCSVWKGPTLQPPTPTADRCKQFLNSYTDEYSLDAQPFKYMEQMVSACILLDTALVASFLLLSSLGASEARALR